MAAGVTKRTEPVQDRLIKAKRLGKAGVGMQRIPVARESIQQRLIFVNALLDALIGWARGRHIDLCAGTAIATPATDATHKGRDLVAHQELAGVVVAIDGSDHHRALALVEDVFNTRLVRQLRLRR